MRTPGGERRCNSTTGVLPIRSSSEAATTPVLLAAIPARHRGQEHDRRALADGCVQPVARPYVLAVHVEVDVGADLAAVVDPVAERREPRREILEQLPQRRPGRLDLLRAPGLLTEHGGNPDDTHRVQNST